MGTDSKSFEYNAGAKAALSEARAIALAYSTAAGVLSGANTGKILLSAFDAVLVPLIEKYTATPLWAGFDYSPAANHQLVLAVVERVFSRQRVSKGVWRVDFEAMNVESGDRVRHSLTFRSSREARKCRPGKTVTWEITPPAYDFDEDLPF